MFISYLYRAAEGSDGVVRTIITMLVTGLWVAKVREVAAFGWGWKTERKMITTRTPARHGGSFGPRIVEGY